MYNIDRRTKAYRQLRKIRNRQTREERYDAAETLRHWPDCRNVKALTGRRDMS